MAKQMSRGEGPPAYNYPNAPTVYMAPSASAPPPGPPPMYNPAPQPKKPGKFDKFKTNLNKVGKSVSKGIENVASTVETTLDKNWSSTVLSQFSHGNVLQLVSRASGGTVQIVRTPSQQLTLDSLGPHDPNALNTLFMVVNEGDNQVRLHNYNNYIAVHDGQVVLVHVPPGQTAGPETRFQLSQITLSECVCLQSTKEGKCYLGFIRSGELKSASTTDKGIDGQFYVQLLSKPA